MDNNYSSEWNYSNATAVVSGKNLFYPTGWSGTDLSTDSYSQSITISSAGYATYYHSAYPYTMPTGLTGYIFNTESGDTYHKLVSTYTEGSKVPAGEALVLKGAANTYTLAFTTQTATKSTNNALLGTDAEEDISDEDGFKYYGLSVGTSETNSGKIGFYWMADNGAAFTNGAHKAYLKLAASDAPSHYLFEDGEEIATGIDAIESNEEIVKFFENGQLMIKKGDVIYNALGQIVK